MKAQIGTHGPCCGVYTPGQVLCSMHTQGFGQREHLGACLLQNSISQHSLCLPPSPSFMPVSVFGRVGVAAIPSPSLTTSTWSIMHTCVPSASSAAVWKTRLSILSLPGCWFNPNGSVDGPTPSVAVVWFARVFPRCASGSHHHSSDSLSFLPSSTTPIRFSTPPLRTTINHSYLLTISLCQAPGFFLSSPLLTPHPSPLTSQHSGTDCCCHGMF